MKNINPEIPNPNIHIDLQEPPFLISNTLNFLHQYYVNMYILYTYNSYYT